MVEVGKTIIKQNWGPDVVGDGKLQRAYWTIKGLAIRRVVDVARTKLPLGCDGLCAVGRLEICRDLATRYLCERGRCFETVRVIKCDLLYLWTV